jgi:ribonuclease HI
MRHPSAHNNHFNKTILSQVVELLQSQTHPIYLHKAKTHANITGNEIIDALAKRGNTKHIHYLQNHTNMLTLHLITYTKMSG